MKIVRFAWGGQALFGILERDLIYALHDGFCPLGPVIETELQ